MIIKAPFNFVPLSDHVYFPDWANQISQDIPFSDGISGTIELKITAESPIFVRNGHTQNSDEERFSQTEDGKYFIPGSTIKGALRNVMEILSMGKMTQVQNATFGCVISVMEMMEFSIAIKLSLKKYIADGCTNKTKNIIWMIVIFLGEYQQKN